MEPLLRFGLPVRGVVRHAAQQHVHGEDGAQQLHCRKKTIGTNETSKRCLKFVSSAIRNAGDSGFRRYVIGMKEDSKCDDTRSAASAHPAAVRAEVLPYAVAHHLPAAPPPKQQPALQPAAYRAHHGSTCEQRNLRARVSGPRDAVKTRAQRAANERRRLPPRRYCWHWLAAALTRSG